VNCSKTDEPIEMPYGEPTRFDQGTLEIEVRMPAGRQCYAR